MFRLGVLVLLVSAWLAAPAAANPLPLANASFERPGFAGWQLAGGVTADTLTTPGGAREGTGYGAVTSTTQNIAFSQRVTAQVTAGRSYSYSMWVKSADGSPLDVQIGVFGEGGGVQANLGNFTAGAEWQLIGATLSPAITNTNFWVTLSLKTTGKQLLVDGAQLVDVGLANASFEHNDFEGWSHNLSAAGSQGAVAKDGGRVGVVRSPGGQASFWQDHAVTPSTNLSYTFSLWMRSVSGEPIKGSVLLSGIGGQAFETATTNFTAGNGWTLVTATLNPNQSDHTALRAQVIVSSPDLSLYVDGGQLVTTGLLNAGFDVPYFRGWDFYPNGNLASATGETTSGVARDGVGYGSVRTDVAGRSFLQSVANGNTPAGQSRAFSIWLRSPTGARGRVVISGVVGSDKESGVTPFYVGPAWTLVSAPLASTRENLGLYAEVVIDTPGAELQTDGASMAAGNARDDVIVPGPPPPPPPAAPAADGDGDGVPDASDLCKVLAGTAARRGCPRGLANDTSISYRRSGKAIRVVRYYVAATKGARVVVTCSKKACKKTITKGKGAKRVRIARLNGRRLKHGTKITVTVTMPGRLTTTVVDTVKNGRRVPGRKRCYTPGVTAAVMC